MSVLEENLNAILVEKQTKVIPSNIKQGVTLFGVTGSLNVAEESAKTTAEPSDILMGKTAFSKGKEITGTLPFHDIYKFNSVDEMNRFTLAKDKEYAVIYNDTAAGITANTTYSSVTFPSTVILTDFQYTDVPQIVLDKAKEKAFGYDNYIVLQNTLTGEYYIPHQNSIYNANTFQTTGWKMTWYKDTWSYHSPCWTTLTMLKYDDYSHTFSTTSLSTISTNSTVSYDWGTYKLVPVYASKNILINVGHDDWKSGDVFYRSSNTLTSIGSYPSTLPYVNVDMTSAEFFFNGFSNKVTYTSLDGVVYTRTDTQDSTLSCSVNFATAKYDKVLPYFIKSGSGTNNFLGMYKYYNDKWSIAPNDLNALSSNILLGKKAYTSVGVISGTMTNNGALNYTPSTSNQIIPAGYTSGGSIIGDENLIASNIRADKTIFGIRGTAPITFATVDEMESNKDFPENTLAIVYGISYVGTYKLDKGSWTQIGDTSEGQEIMNTLNVVASSTDEYEGAGGTDEEIIQILNYIEGV